MSATRRGSIVKPVLRRSLNPVHWWRAWRASRSQHWWDKYRAYGDTRLEVIAELLPDGFLNYGYYPPPLPQPDTMSLVDVQRAQRRYGELIADQIERPDLPVLDVGCGMGGLMRILVERGHEATGLTPDRAQASFLARELPGVPILEGKLENLDASAHRGRFGTVITAESLQYLELRTALGRIDELLAPDGRWIAFDYFRYSAEVRGSGHPWDRFPGWLEQAGFTIETDRDLTDNVLPTLAFVHMWASRLGLPLVRAQIADFERRRPGLHHLLEEGLGQIESSAAERVDKLDPAKFRRERCYRLLRIRRST